MSMESKISKAKFLNISLKLSPFLALASKYLIKLRAATFNKDLF